MWISVNDYLPEEGTEVLVYDTLTFYYLCIFKDGKFINDNISNPCEIEDAIYWMKIPNVPE